MIILGLCLSYLGHTQVIGHEGRLLALSTSKKTGLFNLGSHDNIKEFDFAVVIKRTASIDADALRLVPVAKARVVKVSPSESVLVFYKTFDTHQLIEGGVYELYSESQLLNGRKELESRLTQVYSENQKKSEQDFVNNEHPELSQKEDQYHIIQENHSDQLRSTHHAQIASFDSYDSFQDGKYSKLLYKSEYKKEFEIKKRLETFEKMMVNYLIKFNRPNFDYKQFYYDQARDPRMHDLHNESNYVTEYRAFIEAEQKKEKADTLLYRKLALEEGDWSDDYSDEELTNVLKKVGIYYEKDRRRQVSITRYHFQLQLGGGLNFLDNQNRVDQDNSQSTRYHGVLGLEYFPFKRNDSLKHLTLETHFRYMKDGISTGGFNSQLTNYSLAFIGHWYPGYSSHVVGENLFFIGLGLRVGVGKLSIPTEGPDQANYNSLSLPIVQGGLKYNFSSGLGLKITGSIEQLVLERIGTNNDETTNLPREAQLQEARLSFSLTKFI